MFRQFKDDRYLAYAKHLADAYVRMQRPDGSWPYRVDPKDGKVAEDYTSNAVTPARAARHARADRAERFVPHRAREGARVDDAESSATRRWQGMFEDIGARRAFRNLEHFDVNELIRYLVHYREQDPSYVLDGRAAQSVHRRPVRRVARRATRRSPTGARRARCSSSTRATGRWSATRGDWLVSLLALHRATGNQTYLDKAIAAGNAIVRGQHPAEWRVLDVGLRQPLRQVAAHARLAGLQRRSRSTRSSSCRPISSRPSNRGKPSNRCNAYADQDATP